MSDSVESDIPGILVKIVNERGILYVRNLLGNVIDFDESIKEASVAIRSGVSEVLDAARARYEDLDNVRLIFFQCCWGLLLTRVVLFAGPHRSRLSDSRIEPKSLLHYGPVYSPSRIRYLL